MADVDFLCGVHYNVEPTSVQIPLRTSFAKTINFDLQKYKSSNKINGFYTNDLSTMATQFIREEH